MADNKKRLAGFVEQSGFPLQIAVEHLARQGYNRDHGWDSVTHEHPWRGSNSAGFIDVVLQSGNLFLLIECKRTTASWIFLCPRRTPESVHIDRIRCRLSQDQGRPRFQEMHLTPASIESEFCVVGGSGSKHRILESDCSTLLDVEEAFGVERETALRLRQESFRAAYIPAIVTTADLQSCVFDPGAVDLSSGVPTGAVFKPEKWVRFRKTLSADLSEAVAADDLEAAREDRERTVLILRAEALGEFLAAATHLMPPPNVGRSSW